MYQKDYILRMIDMLGDLLAAIFGYIKKGDYSTAGTKLDNLYYDLLREDAALFRAIPAGQLTQKLLHEHNYTNGHLEILAELFYAEAELNLAQERRAESLSYYERSLILLEFTDRELKTFSSDRMEKMDLIRKRIRDLKIP